MSTPLSGKRTVREPGEDIDLGDTMALLAPPLPGLPPVLLEELPPEDRQWVYPPGMRPYEPLRECPGIYLDFMRLGELVWETPEPWPIALASRVLEFTRDYGPLSMQPLPTLGEVLTEAKSVARVGMAHRALKGEAEAEKAYWPRALWAYGRGFDSGPTLAPGSAALRGFIAADIEGTVNRHMKTYAVYTQVRRAFGQRGQPPSFEPSYEPSSLRGVIWAQFASSLFKGSVYRRCKFSECHRMFAAPSPRSLLAYCPDRDCQVKANDRIKYQKRRAAELALREATKDGKQ